MFEFHRWLYGDAACKAYAFEGIFVGLAAIGFVVALCVERYVVSKRSGSSKCVCMCVCVHACVYVCVLARASVCGVCV